MRLLRPVEKFIPPYGRWPLLAALALNCGTYYFSRLIAGQWPHHGMAVGWDQAVPLWPWTVTVYVAAYGFWAVNYILAVRQGRDRAWRFLAADGLGKLICFAVFLLWPTAAVRPEIPAGAPFGRLLGLIYALDAPDNLFPSIHCFNSWLCWAGLRGRRTVPGWYRAFSLVFALAIAASTLTTKQHVLADAAAGILLAEACWQLAGHTGLAAGYGRIWRRRAAGASDGS